MPGGPDPTGSTPRRSAVRRTTDGDLARFHLAAIVESSEDAIVSKDLDGVIQTWNVGAERVFGYAPHEAIGRHISMLIPPSRQDEEPAILARIRRGERIEHYETVRVRKDGRLIDVSLTVSPIKDGAERIIGASKIARDITMRKRADEAASFLAAIVESSHDAIVGKALDGTIQSWNRAAQRMLGYAPEEIVGRPVSLLIPPDRVEEESKILERVRRGESVEQYETVRRAKDGSRIDVSLTVSPVRDPSGRIIGASKIVRDIGAAKRGAKEREELLAREQAARAEAEAANRAKDEFLATVSHELRTPLNAILGWAQVLGTGRHDDATVNRALETIIRNAKHQAQLIEDLLDLSRIVSGRLRLNARPVDVSAALIAALETVRPAVDAKRLQLETSVDRSVPAVLGDSERLQQVFWNLLSNAVKFTPADGRIDVRLERSGSRVITTVVDTGIGIPASMLPVVFDRFRQGPSSIARSHTGLGLGLAIVRQLVELHGGTVEAASAGEGKGSTFTVSLPIIPLRAPFDDIPRPRHPSLTRCDGVRVLVVDDEADGREMLKLFLEECGATVSTAASADEGLAAIQDSPPDVLISDLAMPGVDGYAFIRQVRSLPGGRAVPAVALTAHANADARARAFLAGFDVYVAKPVEPGELVAVVARFARRRKDEAPPP